MTAETLAIPANATACLLLADGTMFFGESIGADGISLGEICYNTGMTGYQEVLTDLSYAGQIVCFTFPHIGNVGCNDEDIESHRPAVRGLVVRERITDPSNYRHRHSLTEWLQKWGVVGISGVDTRALTRHIRMKGAQNAAIVSRQSTVDSRQLAEAREKLRGLPSLKGMELAKTVTTNAHYEWSEKIWQHTPTTNDSRLTTTHHVVAIDYGEKLNILRSLAERGCKVTVVPSHTTAEQILALNPDGVFLSNGPGDPAATAQYAVPEIQKLIEKNLPIFGICLGHQLLGLAVGGHTEKMHQGHRGANHPVKNLQTGAVEITSQNHGFCVKAESLPENAEVTHVSLFDNCLEGFRLKDKPVFAVQYHPESSPGPHDSQYLFDQFVGMMEKR